MIIGQDLEDLCDDNRASALITDVLNRPTSRKMRGLHPSEKHPEDEKRVIMQGMHEMREMPVMEVCDKPEVNGKSEETHDRDNNQSNDEDRKPSPQCDPN